MSAALLSSAENKRVDWIHHFHQKMYDEYNIELNQAEYQLKEAEGLTTMTGNWNGARTYLEQHGVLLSASFVTDMVGNPSGGHARGFAYAGSFGLGLGLDFEKMAGVTGFSFYSTAVWRTGTSLTMRKIHNQFTVQQVFGSQEVKLNELYLQQTFWDRNIFIKAGRLDAGNDFLASPFYAEFVNNGFDGNPVSLFNNFSSFTAYPNATWGAYFSMKPIPQFLARFAVYNANSNIFLNKYHGTNFTFQSTNGVIWIGECVALVNQNTGDEGMPGNYKVGLIYQTGAVQEFKNGNINGDYCYYFLLDQMIYRPNGPKTGQGLTPFIALLFAPSNRNLFPFFVTTGLVYKGLFPKRPDDTTNLGFVYGEYSSQLAQVERTAKKQGLLGPFGNQPQSYEAVIELNHWIQVNEWFTFTPDFQYIINPQGFGTIPNAFVLGVQIGFVL